MGMELGWGRDGDGEGMGWGWDAGTLAPNPLLFPAPFAPLCVP